MDYAGNVCANYAPRQCICISSSSVCIIVQTIALSSSSIRIYYFLTWNVGGTAMRSKSWIFIYFREQFLFIRKSTCVFSSLNFKLFSSTSVRHDTLAPTSLSILKTFLKCASFFSAWFTQRFSCYIINGFKNIVFSWFFPCMEIENNYSGTRRRNTVALVRFCAIFGAKFRNKEWADALSSFDSISILYATFSRFYNCRVHSCP